MWLFESIVDAAAVTSVTLGWWHRSKQPSISPNRAFAQLLSLVLSTYLAVAFAILTEMRAARAPLAISVGGHALIAHVMLGVVSMALGFFGSGRVRVAALSAAVVTTLLWLISNRIS